jgi:predicted 3-demethylubiquinone-9 3-methyltransferase (glyoxalase superfamily)
MEQEKIHILFACVQIFFYIGSMQTITPFLWFDTEAEEAVAFYVSVFPNSKIGAIARYPEGSPGPAGTVMTVEFEINGQPFVALNGGPIFKFTEAISFVVGCESQEEIDKVWDKLSAHPENEQCGWLKDKYGVSWQIVPAEMGKIMSQRDPEKSKRVMQAMLQMKKLDIAKLKEALE